MLETTSYNLLLKSREILKKANIDSFQIDSLILLCFALNKTKEDILLNSNLEILPSQKKIFFDLVQRRAKNEPISYIIGKREFYGIEFLVSKDVLDPRPDSESLIDNILEIIPNKNQKLKILELGVGSGCLILTLLNLYQNSSAIAVDLSKEA